MISILMNRLIKPFEGLHKLLRGKVYAYICPAGYPTQGFGLLVESLAVPPISPAEAERRLEARLPYYVRETFALAPRLWLETPERQAAIVDFVFNLGAPRFRASTLRKAVNAGDWEWAARELAKWVNGGGRRLPGLVARRAAEIALLQHD